MRCPFFERSIDQISIEYRITEEGTMSALIRCANNIYLFMECGVDDMWQSNGSCSSNSPTFGMLDQLSLLLKKLDILDLLNYLCVSSYAVCDLKS